MRVLAAHVLGLLVGAEPDEDRVSQPAVAGPLGEAHLADEARLHPVIDAPVRPGVAERRGVASERLELRPELVLHRIVEPAADAGHVPELPVLVDTDVQRAEVPAAAARLGPAADHEFLPALALDLDPV